MRHVIAVADAAGWVVQGPGGLSHSTSEAAGVDPAAGLGWTGQAGRPRQRYFTVGTVEQFGAGADGPFQPVNQAVFATRCGAFPMGPQMPEICWACHGGGAPGWVAQRP